MNLRGRRLPSSRPVRLWKMSHPTVEGFPYPSPGGSFRPASIWRSCPEYLACRVGHLEECSNQTLRRLCCAALLGEPTVLEKQSRESGRTRGSSDVVYARQRLKRRHLTRKPL